MFIVSGWNLGEGFGAWRAVDVEVRDWFLRRVTL